MSQVPQKRRLLWRVYLYGVLMLLLSASVSLAVGRYVLQPAYEVPTRPSTTWIAWHIAAIQHEPARVQAELADLRRERFGHVVVGAELEAEHLVGLGRARRQHHDRRRDRSRPQVPADVLGMCGHLIQIDHRLKAIV